MDTREFFRDVVSPNYHEFFKGRDDVRLLWNAVVSMNSVAEYLALHQLGYHPTSRKDLELAAKKICEQYALLDLKFCAETFKHVRKIKDRGGGTFELTGSSTGITLDKTTWMINEFDVVDVLQKAFAKLNQISELK